MRLLYLGKSNTVIDAEMVLDVTEYTGAFTENPEFKSDVRYKNGDRLHLKETPEELFHAMKNQAAPSPVKVCELCGSRKSVGVHLNSRTGISEAICRECARRLAQ